MRFVFTVLFSLASSAFVYFHSLLQGNFLHYGSGMDTVSLPLPTRFFFRFGALGFMLPAAAALGLLLRGKNGEAAEIFREWLYMAIILASVAWVFSSLLSWQLPYYFPVAIIK